MLRRKILCTLIVSLMLWATTGCVNDYVQDNDGLAAVYGSVVDAVSGAPVANAQVRLHEGSSGLHSLDGIVGSAVTGSDGYFSFTDIVVEPGMRM